MTETLLFERKQKINEGMFKNLIEMTCFDVGIFLSIFVNEELVSFIVQYRHLFSIGIAMNITMNIFVVNITTEFKNGILHPFNIKLLVNCNVLIDDVDKELKAYLTLRSVYN